jgi:uncharacterized NAD(P)/FAD-binding protein YdhS
MKHVAIIGGGFSGTLTAINLSRLSAGPLKITVINKGYPLGRGVAYSTRNGHHLLNVAARNMSALADQPNHFVEWLYTRSEYLDEPPARLREKFVPRKIYGDYLHSLLLSQSSAAADKKIQIESIAQEAVEVVLTSDGATVTLADGQTIAADKVVLATGNQPPSNLKIKGLDTAHPRYFQNPWLPWESKLTDRTENIILVGTGLTMIDTFISLKDLDWKGKIYAISRNGLLPLSHFKATDFPALIDNSSQAGNLRKIFHLFKKQFRNARAEGVNPAILVDKLRPFTQQIWQGFSLLEKKRFNRHFRTRWNVVRHRIAQSIHQQLLEAIAAHRLEIVKGRLWEVKDCGDQFLVTVKTGKSFLRIEGGALINCTGPSESFSHSQSHLYQGMSSNGAIQPDEMDMGIQVAPDFSVIEQNGKESQILFAIGPALKGTLWESSAVPELRSQTFRVAETLAKQLSGKPTSDIKETIEPVQEYEI